MSLGIDFRVNTQPIVDAKKVIVDTSKALEELASHGEIDIDVNTGEFAVLTRSMTDTMRKLETMNSRISASGGQKTVSQEQEAARLLQKQKTDAEAYERALAKIGTQLDLLYERKRKLEKTEFIVGSDEQRQAKEELDRINKELDSKTSAYDKIQSKYDPRVNRALHGSAAAGDDIAGYGTKQEADSGIKKMLGMGLALWGGVSAISLIRESWEKFKQQSQLESGLAVRGVSYSRSSEWSYLPGESAEMAMSLRRATGAHDTKTQNALQGFARMGNMDAGTAVGLMGGYYQATGASHDEQIRATKALIYLGDKAKDGRQEALLSLINANLQSAQQAQGGKELSPSQRASIMANTTAMYNAPGTMGFTSGLFNNMQSALNTGGDATSELIKWGAAGGFEGPMTFEKMMEIKGLREKGLNDKGVREKLREMMHGMSPQGKKQLLYQFQPDWKVAQYDQYLNLFGDSEPEGISPERIEAYLKNGKDPGGKIGAAADKKAGAFRGTAWGKDGGVGQRAVKREVVKQDAGKIADDVLGPVENAVIDIATKLVSGAGDVIAPIGKVWDKVEKALPANKDGGGLHNAPDADKWKGSPENLPSFAELMNMIKDLPKAINRLVDFLDRRSSGSGSVLPVSDEKPGH